VISGEVPSRVAVAAASAVGALLIHGGKRVAKKFCLLMNFSLAQADVRKLAWGQYDGAPLPFGKESPGD